MFIFFVFVILQIEIAFDRVNGGYYGMVIIPPFTPLTKQYTIIINK